MTIFYLGNQDTDLTLLQTDNDSILKSKVRLCLAHLHRIVTDQELSLVISHLRYISSC